MIQSNCPSPIEVECRFSVLSGYLQCSTECRLLAIFGADKKIHCSRLECVCVKMTKMNQGRNRVP